MEGEGKGVGVIFFLGFRSEREGCPALWAVLLGGPSGRLWRWWPPKRSSLAGTALFSADSGRQTAYRANNQQAGRSLSCKTLRTFLPSLVFFSGGLRIAGSALACAP